MLFGGTQFTQIAYEKEVCTDVSATVFNAANNCTTVTIDAFAAFNNVAYWFFRLTLGVETESVI